MLDRSAPVFVAGHQGMVGSALVRREAGGYANLLTHTRAQLDLTDQRAVFGYLAAQRPEYLFVAAAQVGGVQANNTRRAEVLYDNLAIEANLIHGAHRVGVQRLIFFASSCIYPRDCAQPIRENALLTGPLEPTDEPNAIAKIAYVTLAESKITVILANIKRRLDDDGVLSGYTIVERADGVKHIHQHEYEFHDMDDLKRFLTPHFRNVKAFETIHPSRHNLYFWASDGVLPSDSAWRRQVEANR